MTAALTPALALAYLRELQPDVRAAFVLDAHCATLAGEASLAVRAGPLLDGLGAGETRGAPAGAEVVLASRGPDGAAIAVLAGPQALPALLRHDVEHTLAALAPTSPPAA